MILDTNALFAWWDGNGALDPILESLEQICVPVPALAEFRFGVLQSTKRELMESRMEQALLTTRILPADDTTTGHYAAIRLELKRKGNPIPMNDLWISAIARQHRLPILSRDTHFDAVHGIKRISW